jgi:hypothetical protein
MLVDKAVKKNDLSLNTRVILSVVPSKNLMNDVYEERKKLAGHGGFPVILSPHSNRGERIGERYSNRETTKYACVMITTREKKRSCYDPRPIFPSESLRPEQTALSPVDALNY